MQMRAELAVCLTVFNTHIHTNTTHSAHKHMQSYIQNPTSGLRAVCAKYLVEQATYWKFCYSYSLTSCGAKNINFVLSMALKEQSWSHQNLKGSSSGEGE